MTMNIGNRLGFSAYKISEENDYIRDRGLIQLNDGDKACFIPTTSISKMEQIQGSGPQPISIYLKGEKEPLITNKARCIPAYYFPNIVILKKPNEN